MNDADHGNHLLAQAFVAQLACSLHDDATALEVLSEVLGQQSEGAEVAALLARLSRRVRMAAESICPESAPRATARELLIASGAEPHPDQLALGLQLPRRGQS